MRRMVGYRRAGFTIVELLIVIVVIGILASIALVTYNGIQHRARVQVVRTDMQSVAKSVAMFKQLNDRTPNTAAEFSEILKESGVYNSTRTDSKSYAICSSASGYAMVAWNPLINSVKRGETLYLYQDVGGHGVHTLTNSSLESSQTLDKVCDQVHASSTYEVWTHNLP